MNIATVLYLAVAGVSWGAAVVPEDAGTPGGNAITANYTCEVGMAGVAPSLMVVFEGNSARVTPIGDKGIAGVYPGIGTTITLSQSIAADGFLYTNGENSLRGRGNEVTWTTVGYSLKCTARNQ